MNMNMKKNFRRGFRTFNKYYNQLAPADMLGYLGLQRRRSSLDYVLPAVGLIGVGVAVGVGIGMALVFKAGAQLRIEVKEDLKYRVNEIRDKVTSASNTTGSVGLHSL
jgi:hypothetical protein